MKDPTKLNQDEANTLIRLKATNDIEQLLKISQLKIKKAELGGFSLEIYHTFKEEPTPEIIQYYRKECLQIQFMKPVSPTPKTDNDQQ